MSHPESLITSRDLWDAVAAFDRPQTRTLREGDYVEKFTVPPLWTQLYEAIDKNTGDQGNSKMQSRPPVNTNAMSLLIEIATAVRYEKWDRKLKTSQETPLELRAIISDVIRGGNVPSNTDGMTTWEWWEWCIRSWNTRIRTVLGQTLTHRLYGAACRTCHASTVPAFDEQGNPAGRQPALIVHIDTDTELVTSVACDMCGTILEDHHLQGLWDQARRAKEWSTSIAERA